jgi:hypothetical protein
VITATWSVAAALVLFGLVALLTFGSIQRPLAQPGLPAQVKAFARTLPASQRPNSAGLTMVDGTDAPDSWRVAWESVDAAFCFAFVHQSGAPQTLCGAPGSVRTAMLRIGGEISDTGFTPPDLVTCGYVKGDDPGFVEIDDDAVVGTAVDMGSGLYAFCLHLPYDTAAGQSFTLSTGDASEPPDGRLPWIGVTATYH